MNETRIEELKAKPLMELIEKVHPWPCLPPSPAPASPWLPPPGPSHLTPHPAGPWSLLTCVRLPECVCTCVRASLHWWGCLSRLCVRVCVCVCLGICERGKGFSFWLFPFPQRGRLCVRRGVSRKDPQKLWGQGQSPPNEEGHTDRGPPSPRAECPPGHRPVSLGGTLRGATQAGHAARRTRKGGRGCSRGPALPLRPPS